MPIVEFIEEKIEVETIERFPAPARFAWRGDTYEVADVISEHVDTGYGMLPPASRKWYTRRHRRYFTVRDSHGDVFDMYMDYADRRKIEWWLTKRTKHDESE